MEACSAPGFKCASAAIPLVDDEAGRQTVRMAARLYVPRRAKCPNL